MSAAEFDLIARIHARATTRADVVLGIGDDAAVLQPSLRRQLVVATDTLNRGVHFDDDAAAADIGWKSLAVNLSDLAAMGAEPAWCTLSLSLPAQDGEGLTGFVDGFLDGFLELAARHGVALVGGDTTRGPLSVCVTAMGFVEPGQALRRDAARVGDEVWITGTLGDAAAALSLAGVAPYRDHPVRAQGSGEALFARLHRPTPRVAAGRALRGLAHAAIDVSDGLLADLGHICVASNLRARIDADALPASPALAAACGADARTALQVSGGDDYELCFTASPQRRDEIARALRASDTPACVIGWIEPRSTPIASAESAPAVRVCRADGSWWTPTRNGYQHFG